MGGMKVGKQENGGMDEEKQGETLGEKERKMLGIGWGK